MRPEGAPAGVGLKTVLDEMKWVFYAPGGWFPLWDFPPMCSLPASEVGLYTMPAFIHQGEVGCGSLARSGICVVWLRAF